MVKGWSKRVRTGIIRWDPETRCYRSYLIIDYRWQGRLYDKGVWPTYNWTLDRLEKANGSLSQN